MDLNLENRNFGLDIVRAASILLVVYSHMFHKLSFQCGLLGVEVFFVLSGFLIGGIIYRCFALNGNLQGKDLLNFWKRRWWRTLPLYYLIIIIKFIYNHSIGFKFFHFVFFIQNYFNDKFFAVSWSLAIEEWFYLLVPVLIFLFYRSALNKQNITWYLLVFILLIAVLKLVWEMPFQLMRINIPLRMDSLCVGVLMAFIKNLRTEWYHRLKSPFVFMIALALIGLLFYFTIGFVSGNGILAHNAIIRAFWFPLLSTAIVLTFPFMENNTLINSTLKEKKWVLLPVTVTALIAYSMYLIHTIVLAFTNKHLVGVPFHQVIAFVIIYIISYLLYRFYERPMTSRREV